MTTRARLGRCLVLALLVGSCEQGPGRAPGPPSRALFADLLGNEPAAEGRATIRDLDGRAIVYVELPKGSGSEWSVRIREGDCTNPGAVIEMLGVAEGGTIRTSVASPAGRLGTAIVTVSPIGEPGPVLSCGVLDWEPQPSG